MHLAIVHKAAEGEYKLIVENVFIRLVILDFAIPGLRHYPFVIPSSYADLISNPGS
jgi:hypothetical protein